MSDSVKCCRQYTESGDFCPSTVQEPAQAGGSNSTTEASAKKSTPIPDSAFKEFDEFYFDVEDGPPAGKQNRRRWVNPLQYRFETD